MEAFALRTFVSASANFDERPSELLPFPVSKSENSAVALKPSASTNRSIVSRWVSIPISSLECFACQHPKLRTLRIIVPIPKPLFPPRRSPFNNEDAHLLTSGDNLRRAGFPPPSVAITVVNGFATVDHI